MNTVESNKQLVNWYSITEFIRLIPNKTVLKVPIILICLLVLTTNTAKAQRESVIEGLTKNWHKSLFWMQLGDVVSELDYYTKVLLKKPNNYEALIYFGVYNFRITQDYTKAIGFLEKAKFIDPGNIIAYYVLYKIYYQIHDKYQAIKVYKEFVKIRPDNSNGHDVLAYAYFDNSQLFRALMEFIIAKRLNPSLDISSGLCWVLLYIFILDRLPILFLITLPLCLIKHYKKKRISKKIQCEI